MLEIAGGNPMEEASITFTDSDSIALGCNVQSTGQSHATVFAQLLADQLGVGRGDDRQLEAANLPDYLHEDRLDSVEIRAPVTPLVGPGEEHPVLGLPFCRQSSCVIHLKALLPVRIYG